MRRYLIKTKAGLISQPGLDKSERAESFDAAAAPFFVAVGQLKWSAFVVLNCQVKLLIFDAINTNLESLRCRHAAMLSVAGCCCNCGYLQ